MFAFAQELQSLNQKDKELQRGGPGVTAVPARKGGWWVAVTAARVRTSYHKKLLVLQSSGIPAIRRRSRPGVGAQLAPGGYRTGRVQPQDGGVLPDRLALEEAGAAHESRHGVVDHRRGYARGRRSVG
jgi:hypothetical protein